MRHTSRQPSYRLHKARNTAVVTIDGRNHYLGPYDSPESHEEYARLIAEWRRNGNHLPPPLSGNKPNRCLHINQLILSYFQHVQVYYVKHGKQTSEVTTSGKPSTSFANSRETLLRLGEPVIFVVTAQTSEAEWIRPHPLHALAGQKNGSN